MPAARPTEALIKRSISAWMANGLPIGGIEVRADGLVRILAPSEVETVPSPEKPGDEAKCDELFGVSD